MIPSSALAADEPLSPRHRVMLAAEIVGAYVRVRWRLRGGDLERTMADLRRGDGATNVRVDGPRAATTIGLRLGRAVARTLRVLPTDSRCLWRSVVLADLLGRRGIHASLVIGVRPAPGFEAHAWVECGGQQLLWPGEAGLERLVEI